LGLLAWRLDVVRFLGRDDPLPVREEVQVTQSTPSSLDRALALLDQAAAAFASVVDYRCTHLRDELIDGELKKNHLLLKIRHEPFSVSMEWVAPRSKRGRRVLYVHGLNDGKMIVRDMITLRLDPKKSIEMKESRHTILEAGIKNLLQRFQRSWHKEKELGRTEVSCHEGEAIIHVGATEYRVPCITVETRHRPEDRQLFQFYRCRLFFDRRTNLPFQMEGYDWPTSASELERPRLAERYVYLDVQSNVGLTDEDFK